MSLDVALVLKGVQNLEGHTAIFIREDGQTKEVTRAEWDARYPDREPITVELPSDEETVFSANITHNLNYMADAAGIYQCVWRPEAAGITKAAQLIEPLSEGLEKLRAEPERFRQYDAPNGWGTYEDFVPCLERYLEACREFPDADVLANR